MTTTTREQARHHKMCGCVITCLGTTERELRITYCPLHAAAPEMAEILRRLVAIADAARDLLKRIDGGCGECGANLTTDHHRAGCSAALPR